MRDDDDDEGPLHFIKESRLPALCLHDTSLDGAELVESRQGENELHVCIAELITVCFKLCIIYLEESEGSPFQLLCALWWLNEAGEASLPDLQNKQGSGNFLWRADNFSLKIKQLNYVKIGSWSNSDRQQTQPIKVEDTKQRVGPFNVQ